MGPRSLLLVLAALAAFPCGRRLLGAEVIDRILVHVDSRVITKSSFDERFLRYVRESGTTLSDAQALEMKRAVMEDLVNESLLEDRARALDLMATEPEVEGTINRLKEQNQVATDEDFARALSAHGLTLEQLREQLRHSMSVQRVVGREVYGKIDLGDDALRLAYERGKESWRIPERVRISEILIPRGEGNAGEAKVLEVVQKLNAGIKFEELVPRYSSGETRDRAGDLGFVSRGELNPEVESVVFPMLVGSVSNPVATAFGWHIVKVVDRTPAGTRPYSEVKADILKKEQETRFPKKLAEYLDVLKRESVIKVSEEAAAFYTAPVKVVPAPVQMKPTSKAPE